MQHDLDVSDLEPPEPMEHILRAIGKLEVGDYLYVLHRREPHLIYPILDNMGITWLTRTGGAKGYEVFIWRKDDAAAGAAVSARR